MSGEKKTEANAGVPQFFLDDWHIFGVAAAFPGSSHLSTYQLPDQLVQLSPNIGGGGLVHSWCFRAINASKRLTSSGSVDRPSRTFMSFLCSLTSLVSSSNSRWI